MAVTILEKPHTIAFSRNPVNYSLITDTAITTAGLTIEVKLFFQAFNTVGFSEVITLPLTPDNTGKVQVDFKKILDSLVNFELPTFDIAVQKAFAQVGFYYIDYREITTATPNPAWLSQMPGTPHVVIKGGLPYERWQGPNWFVNFDYPEKPYLTWQPSGRECATWEKMWLSYFHMKASDSEFVVKYKVVYTDSTVNTDKELSFPAAEPTYCGIYRFPTGIDQLGLTALEPAKKIYYYEVQIFDRLPDGDLPITTPYLYYVDYTIDYQTQQFNYFNSLGSIDSIRILGDIERVVEYERDIAENNPGHEYYIDENLVPMLFTQQVLEQVSFKGNIGWLDAFKTQDLIRDLLVSKGVHQVKYNRWWPINITSRQADLGSLIADKRDLPLEWNYGFTNENYAPEWATIGGMPTCPIVTGLTGVVLDLATASINWIVDSKHITFTVELSLADGSIVSTLFNQLPPVNVSRIGPNKRVRVKANCGFANSGWSIKILVP